MILEDANVATGDVPRETASHWLKRKLTRGEKIETMR